MPQQRRLSDEDIEEFMMKATSALTSLAMADYFLLECLASSTTNAIMVEISNATDTIVEIDTLLEKIKSGKS